MLGLPLAFTAPAVLFGLLALPVIWWLLRLTPPRPQTEVFPPLAILSRIARKEETPAHSPWWLTALRLLLAALIVLALAGPVLNPRENALAESGPLAIVMDNGWSTNPDWEERAAAAGELIDDAEERAVPVSIVFTADPDHDATPVSAAQAREKLEAAAPAPQHGDRADALDALRAGLSGTTPGTIAFLSNGMESDGDETAFLSELSEFGSENLIVYGAGGGNPVALTSAGNGTDGFSVTATRLDTSAATSYPVFAHDVRGRSIAEGTLSFAAGEARGTGEIAAPFELRNDFARISLAGIPTAGATFLLDDSFRRRRVALLAGAPADGTQPLLSPLHYIEQALTPYADIVRPEAADLSEAVPELIERQPSVIVMADIGTLPESAYEPLENWIENGGMLLRFAGPRLAGASADDSLIPVSLRQGERALGGALSWSEPQHLASFPDGSPFAGMTPPEDVVVSRQVLAQPSPELADNTWASLADGTPLVTSRATGDGRLVLFHVTAEATWSNLPISGAFVEMLRRTVMLANAAGAGPEAGGERRRTLPPYRLLDAGGLLVAPSGNAKPLEISGEPAEVSFDNPPGLYGTEDGFSALNLMRPDATLTPLQIPTDLPLARADYGTGETVSLKPALFAAAFVLLLADMALVLFMAGALRRPQRRSRQATTAAALAIAATAWVFCSPGDAVAQDTSADQRPGDEAVMDRLETTHIAYVVTGNAEVDETSERGLAGLSRFLSGRTALEPGAPVGLDLEEDELSLFPLIYWPMAPGAPIPSDEAVARIDTYMKNGGTVLFDTRDQFTGFGNTTSPETERLRAILADLDIPPLEPVPAEHVLTKTFYLLAEFPGRYRGSELWVEDTADADPAARGISSGDGVSSVIITGNDFAAAWAVDENGVPLYPTIPADPMQREHAYRTGVNIMMYMLTGNYKTDQVHVPALLERLGQ